MAFKFSCRACGQRIEAEEDQIGQVAPCPNCGAELVVAPPAGPQAAAPVGEVSSKEAGGACPSGYLPKDDRASATAASFLPTCPGTRLQHAAFHLYDDKLDSDALANILQKEISKNGKRWPRVLTAHSLALGARRVYFPSWYCGGSGSARWHAQVGTSREVQGECSSCFGKGYTVGVLQLVCDNRVLGAGKGLVVKMINRY